MSNDGNAYAAKERLIGRMREQYEQIMGKEPPPAIARKFEEQATRAAERCNANRQHPYAGKSR